MVYFSDELELWWFEGIIRGEVDIKEEDATGEGGVIRSHDSCLPVEGILFVLGASRAVSGWVLAQVNKFFLDALQCHFVLLLVLGYQVLVRLLNPSRPTK